MKDTQPLTQSRTARQIVDELFGVGSPLDDRQLAEALRNANGDLSIALHHQLGECRAHLGNLTASRAEQERVRLQGALLHRGNRIDLSVGEMFQDRVGFLRGEATRLNDEIAALTQPPTVEEDKAIELATDDLDHEKKMLAAKQAKYGSDHPEVENQQSEVRNLYMLVLRLTLHKHIRPYVAQAAQSWIGVANELAREALRDQRAYTQFRQLLEQNLQDVGVHEKAASSDKSWLEENNFLVDLTQNYLDVWLQKPVGALAQAGAQTLLNNLLDELLSEMPSPSLVGAHGAPRLNAWLENLPAWSGCDAAARLLWGVTEPIAIVSTPPGFVMAPNRPRNCQLITRPGVPQSLVVTTYKFLSLPSIGEWKQWKQAFTNHLQANGGYAVASGEPWAADENQKLLDDFELALKRNVRVLEPKGPHHEISPPDLNGHHNGHHDDDEIGRAVYHNNPTDPE